MYKLRQTWPDIIPNKQLYLLDVKVQRIDPAWPITAKAPEHGVIHVNPKFLKVKHFSGKIMASSIFCSQEFSR